MSLYVNELFTLIIQDLPIAVMDMFSFCSQDFRRLVGRQEMGGMPYYGIDLNTILSGHGKLLPVIFVHIWHGAETQTSNTLLEIVHKLCTPLLSLVSRTGRSISRVVHLWVSWQHSSLWFIWDGMNLQLLGGARYSFLQGDIKELLHQ